MKPIKNNGRKDMDDLKQDIINAANTSKEIIQDQIRDAKSDAEDAMNAADEQMQNVVEKTQSAAAEIKRGSIGVAGEIKQAAINVARAFTAPSEADVPARTDDPPFKLNAHVQPATATIEPGTCAPSGRLQGECETMVHTVIAPGVADPATQIIGEPSQADIELVMGRVNHNEEEN